MITLGIDTSDYANAVGVSDGSRVLADSSFPARTDSLEQIVANIDSVLKSVGISLKEVDGIGVGLGPGSWTGIKVGVTVGKMLAFSTSRPVAGIPTFEALAYMGCHESSFMCSVISAGIGDAVYAAFYRNGDNLFLREGKYFTGSVKDLVPLLKEPVLLVGSNVASYYEMVIKEIVSLKNKVKVMEAPPTGAAVACLAGIRLKQDSFDDPLSLTPLYLKESTAKVFINKYTGGA